MRWKTYAPAPAKTSAPPAEDRNGQPPNLQELVQMQVGKIADTQMATIFEHRETGRRPNPEHIPAPIINSAAKHP
jgi:hypothetical protein